MAHNVYDHWKRRELKLCAGTLNAIYDLSQQPTGFACFENKYKECKEVRAHAVHSYIYKFCCDDISAVVIEFVVGSIRILQKKSIHDTKQNNVRVSIFFFLINNTAAGGRGRVRRGGVEATELRGEHTL